MKIRLGYVALPLTLSITSSSSFTYTNYQKMSEEQAKKKLDEVIRSNLRDLKKILEYNQKNDVSFFRLTSKLIPLATLKQIKFDYIKPYQKEYEEIRQILKKYPMRFDMHPDQFTVLNSDRKEVVENAVAILDYHNKILEALDIKDGKLILHVGSSVGGKKNAIKRFEENFTKLPKKIQKRIILENDDKIYSVSDVLSICQKLKIPMVLDYHHFLCNNKDEKIEDYISAIFHTWDTTGLIPKIHFSSPKNKTKKEIRSHHDYIDAPAFIAFLEKIKWINRDFDVMIEAKAKDRALFDLIRSIKYFTNYTFLDGTSFWIEEGKDNE